MSIGSAVVKRAAIGGLVALAWSAAALTSCGGARSGEPNPPSPGAVEDRQEADLQQLSSPAVGASSLATVANLDPNSYLTWILKSVCIDRQGNLLSADPFYGCPAGSTIRKIRLGDPMPYNNFDQIASQISDSFVLLDAAGRPLYLHDFDTTPFNEFNLYSGSDGYDIYSLIKGNVSFSNTRDGGGYGTTFFGAGCSFGNGWVLFPQQGFSSAGQGYFPISGVYWEQNGQSSPGMCPSGYSTNTLTSWGPRTTYDFGGVKGNPVKAMETVISFHGYETDDGWNPTPNFVLNGHLEVYYYTREYGLTRWEVWTPSQQTMKGSNKEQCNGPSQVVYKGEQFNIQWCRDWSNVVPRAVSNIPAWPVVNANLLNHPHFDAGFSDTQLGMGYWYRFGNSQAGNLINWSLRTATEGGDAGSDPKVRYPGVSYLATNCGAAQGTGCGPAGTQAIYQDLPASSFCGGCTYLYGVDARTEVEGSSGTLQVALQLVNSSHQVVWQEAGGATVRFDNGDPAWKESASVVRSSAFVHKIATLPAMPPDAAFVRFLILPVTPQTFDVVDAFVNRFPAVTGKVVPPPVAGTIPVGTTLAAGASKPFGSLRLSMQKDGNLVLYGPSKALWATSGMPAGYLDGATASTPGTNCTSCTARFQADGNLVLYDPAFGGNANHAFWASGSNAGAGRVYTYDISEQAPYVFVEASGSVIWPN